MMPDREALLVRVCLDDLCRQAGVSPADPTPEAGRAVLRVLAATGLAGERSDPQLCVVAKWLRAATGIVNPIGAAGDRDAPTLLVTPVRVLVLGAGWPRPRAHVELPAAVVAAVGLVDRWQVRVDPGHEGPSPWYAGAKVAKGAA